MLMAFSDTLRTPLFIGVPFLVVPMVWYELRRRRMAETHQ
jgi:hypothetical protein